MRYRRLDWSDMGSLTGFEWPEYFTAGVKGKKEKVPFSRPSPAQGKGRVSGWQNCGIKGPGGEVGCILVDDFSGTVIVFKNV